MTKASEALKKLKSHCNIAYYLNQSDMQAIHDACSHECSADTEVEEKVIRTIGKVKKNETV